MKIIKREAPKDKPKEVSSFGKIFTDHMFVMDYSREKNWHNPRIEPFKFFEVNPANSILHYGQGIFEGLKAYKTKDGEIQLFRPKDNFLRLNRSAERLCIPKIDVEFMVDALKELIKLEQDWIPTEPDTSLYIRPFIVADDDYLGVKPAERYKMVIILSPVGSYYPEGLDPVKILVEDKFVRAVRGGLGEAKTMANYAASLLAAERAQEKGYTQVLWLDGVNLEYIEEVGTMNIFFKIDGKVVTPALNGSILPGITRDSVINVLKHWKIPVYEDKISITEVVNAYKENKLEEVFGTGTAAVISPVGRLAYKDMVMNISNYGADSLAQKIYDFITDIQYGRVEDIFGWIEKIE